MVEESLATVDWELSTWKTISFQMLQCYLGSVEKNPTLFNAPVYWKAEDPHIPAEAVSIFSKGLFLVLVFMSNADLLFLYCLWQYSLTVCYYFHIRAFEYIFFALCKYLDITRGCELLETLLKICLQM